MDVFDMLELVFGLALFLFGMSLMGDALKRSANCYNSVVVGDNSHGCRLCKLRNDDAYSGGRRYNGRKSRYSGNSVDHIAF